MGGVCGRSLTFRDCKSGGWRWRKSLAPNPERADMLWLEMSAAYVWTLSLGANVCLSPKIQRAAVCGDSDAVNVFMLGLFLFQNRLRNRRRIPCALKLPTGLRAAKKAQGSKRPRGGTLLRRRPAGSIPAHAGEPARSRAISPRRAVYPRPRGGTSGLPTS